MNHDDVVNLLRFAAQSNMCKLLRRRIGETEFAIQRIGDDRVVELSWPAIADRARIDDRVAIERYVNAVAAMLPEAKDIPDGTMWDRHPKYGFAVWSGGKGEWVKMFE